MDPAETLVVADELARERVLIDALPYLDNEYEDPTVQSEVRRSKDGAAAPPQPVPTAVCC